MKHDAGADLSPSRGLKWATPRCRVINGDMSNVDHSFARLARRLTSLQLRRADDEVDDITNAFELPWTR